FIDEPGILAKWVSLADHYVGVNPLTPPRNGFYPDFGNMITGAGWLSAGPGYRRQFLDGHGLVDGSAAVSWRAYKIAQARVQFMKRAGGRLTVGSQGRWQDATQVEYFGLGADSVEDSHSAYRLKNTDVVGYASYNATTWLAIGGTFGRLQNLSLSSSTGPF